MTAEALRVIKIGNQELAKIPQLLSEKIVAKLIVTHDALRVSYVAKQAYFATMRCSCAIYIAKHPKHDTTPGQKPTKTPGVVRTSLQQT